MNKKVLYVGIDVHKKTTDVAIAPGRSNGKVRSYGKIDSTVDALNKLIKKLEVEDKELQNSPYQSNLKDSPCRILGNSRLICIVIC